MDARVAERFERQDAAPIAKVAGKSWSQQARGVVRLARDTATRTLNTIRERKLTRPILMIGVPALVALIVAYTWLTGGRYVSTDDAYVRAAKLMVSAEVSGIVSEVDVHEGQAVKKGDVLEAMKSSRYRLCLFGADEVGDYRAAAETGYESVMASYGFDSRKRLLEVAKVPDPRIFDSPRTVVEAFRARVGAKRASAALASAGGR